MLKTKLSTRSLLILTAASALLLFVVLWGLRPSEGGKSAQKGGSGWLHDDLATYYILDDGSYATGWQEIDGKAYYFRSSGSMVTGWLILGDQAHYFLEDGTAASGPVTIGHILHIFADLGIPATGWTTYEGHSLYLDSNGTPLTGWQTIGDTLYYFGQDGIPGSGWLEQDGKKFYIQPDGAVALGRNVIDGIPHYFASNGEEIHLVNPWNYVPEGYTVDLKKIDANYQVAKIAYDDLQLMLADCKRGGGNPTGLQGTNYAARYSIKELKRIKKADLFKGCVVLKSHQPGESGYNLPDNYKPDGKYYNGDLTDFSHIGTVTSVDPLIITHMTSPTSKQDTKIGNWKWYGKSPHVDYEGSEQPMTHATVIAASGSTVNLRKYENTGSALIDRVPINSTVEVLEEKGEWCKVRWKGKTGYMMRQFLAFEGETPVVGGYTVQITGISRNEALALCEKYPDAIMTAG